MCNWARCRSAPCAAWTVRTGALGLAAVAVLALAGTLTAVLYQAARARELDELEEEFAIYSLARASDLIAPFTRHMEALRLVGASVEGPSTEVQVKDSQLGTTTSWLASREGSSLTVIGFVEEVAEAGRAAMEASMRAAYDLPPSFTFLEYNSTVPTVTVVPLTSPRAQYAVFTVFANFETAIVPVGLDLFSEPSRRATMLRARASNALSVLGPTSIVSRSAPQQGFIVFVPVFRAQSANVTATRGQPVNTTIFPFKGYLTASLSLESIMREVVTKVHTPTGVTVLVEDVTHIPASDVDTLRTQADRGLNLGPAPLSISFGRGTPLFCVSARDSEASPVVSAATTSDVAALAALVESLPRPLVTTYSGVFGDHIWAMTVVATPDLSFSSRNSASSIILEAGIPITVCTFALMILCVGCYRQNEEFNAIQRSALTERIRFGRHVHDVTMAYASHELQNPLHVILGTIQVLHDALDRIEGDLAPIPPTATPDAATDPNCEQHRAMVADAREAVASARSDTLVVAHSAEMIRRLVQDLGDFDALKQGQLSLRPCVVSPRTLLFDVISSHANLAKVDLLWRVGAEVPAIAVVDPVRVTQVLSSGLANACKFTVAGNIGVTASLEYRDEYAWLTGSAVFRGRGDDDNRDGVGGLREALSLVPTFGGGDVGLVGGRAPFLVFRILDTGASISHLSQQELFEPFVPAENSAVTAARSSRTCCSSAPPARNPLVSSSSSRAPMTTSNPALDVPAGHVGFLPDGMARVIGLERMALATAAARISQAAQPFAAWIQEHERTMAQSRSRDSAHPNRSPERTIRSAWLFNSGGLVSTPFTPAEPAVLVASPRAPSGMLMASGLIPGVVESGTQDGVFSRREAGRPPRASHSVHEDASLPVVHDAARAPIGPVDEAPSPIVATLPDRSSLPAGPFASPDSREHPHSSAGLASAAVPVLPSSPASSSPPQHTISSGYRARVQGSGLGLAFTRRLARTMGGDLTFRDTQFGLTLFEFCVPLRPPERVLASLSPSDLASLSADVSASCQAIARERVAADRLRRARTLFDAATHSRRALTHRSTASGLRDPFDVAWAAVFDTLANESGSADRAVEELVGDTMVRFGVPWRAPPIAETRSTSERRPTGDETARRPRGPSVSVDATSLRAPDSPLFFTTATIDGGRSPGPLEHRDTAADHHVTLTVESTPQRLHVSSKHLTQLSSQRPNPSQVSTRSRDKTSPIGEWGRDGGTPRAPFRAGVDTSQSRENAFASPITGGGGGGGGGVGGGGGGGGVPGPVGVRREEIVGEDEEIGATVLKKYRPDELRPRIDSDASVTSAPARPSLALALHAPRMHPMDDASPIARKRVPRSRKHTSASPSHHVLLVDDEESVRTLTHRLLDQIGCSVVTLSDGSDVEAELARHRDHPFDLILMDIVMLRSDGADVTRHLVRDCGVTTPIVAMTGNHAPADLERYRKSGFWGLLRKPFDAEDLRRKLSQACVERLPKDATLFPSV